LIRASSGWPTRSSTTTTSSTCSTASVGYSVELLPTDAAGILLADPHGALRVVASSKRANRVDRAHRNCRPTRALRDCFRTGAGQHHRPERRHIGAGRGWPPPSPTANSPPVHALPLRLRGEAIGAMNLFHKQPGALPATDLALGQALADVATIGILQERAIRRGEVLNEQLHTALNSRILIEQAKGVLAQHGKLTMDTAFDRLRSYARGHNLRLSAVAQQVIDTDLAAAVLATPATTRAPAARKP
jgi:hypothetical protein